MIEPVPWNYVFQQVKAAVPAATDALIRQQVFKVMIDFTYGTNVWLESVPVTTAPNVYNYPVPVTSGRPARLMCVYDATNDPPYADLRIYPGPIPETQPRHWVQGGITMRIPGILHVYQPPNEVKNWVAILSKQCGTPQMTTDTPPVPTGYPEIDSWIVDSFADVIVFGVLGNLMAMPAKPFRDPQGAAMNSAYYNSGKSEIRVNNVHGNVFGGQTWLFPQSFATTTRKGWI